MSNLQAPFPWFGGKRKVAPEVWARFGDVKNYVEPFFGSGAVLLGRPPGRAARIETVNDLDGFVANFWRAISADPEGVARHADWPINENDKLARELHQVNVRASLSARVSGDPEFYDVRIAGWWVWGVCAHIGGGYADGNGPWVARDGLLVDSRLDAASNAGRGINRQMPHVGDAGQGINRQMPHLGNAGRGINRQMPHAGDAGRSEFIASWFRDLSARLRHVRVLSGDWERCLSESITTRHGLTGVFLDPPYGEEVEQTRVYASDSGTVAADVRRWCAENGDNPLLRIALCGYEGEGHEALLEHGWTSHAWSTPGGYGGGRGGRGDENRHRERIYFSPACAPEDNGLFDLLGSP